MFDVVFHDSLFVYNIQCSMQFGPSLIPITRLSSLLKPSVCFLESIISHGLIFIHFPAFFLPLTFVRSDPSMVRGVMSQYSLYILNMFFIRYVICRYFPPGSVFPFLSLNSSFRRASFISMKSSLSVFWFYESCVSYSF